jgi:predicted component of type VI protein secretion system
MDLFDIAVLALRLALVLVLYLFLVIVVRVASRGVLAAAPRRTPATRASVSAPLRLLVIEPAGSGLEPGGVLAVADGAVLGRAERSSVVVADPTVSAEHARLDRQGDGWVVADLGSTNGTRLNQQPVHGAAPLGPGDELDLGNVRLRVVGP